jgi:hypothetical protein
MKLPFYACLLGASLAAFAQQPPLLIPVVLLGTAPKVDGDLGEWGATGWVKVPITPALEKSDRAKYGLDPNDDKNQTGSLTVHLKAGVAGDRFYVALKYPDSSEDTSARQWEWRGEKYVEGKQREDMAALRFHMSGDFERSMLSSKDYTVDVWLWSAARTNPSGLAEDMTHHVTTKMLDAAAEYESPEKKTIYIKKMRDAGTAPYKLLPKPRENKGDKLPLFELVTSSGSVADVAAKGRWKAGHWHLEFARALTTGNADDVTFKLGQKIIGQIAIFNQGYAEHKSVSEPLLFDFSAVK